MSRYLMRADDGEEIEVDAPMSNPPKRRTVAGKTYRRVITGGQRPMVNDRPHLAHSAPRKWTPGLAEHYDKWGANGVAAIDSAADKRRFKDALKKALPKTDWQYDP
jgi:hypothetical protein